MDIKEHGLKDTEDGKLLRNLSLNGREFELISRALITASECAGVMELGTDKELSVDERKMIIEEHIRLFRKINDQGDTSNIGGVYLDGVRQ